MSQARWNPYLVGALIGLLSVGTFAIANKPIGMSTGLSQVAGSCTLPFLDQNQAGTLTYWTKVAVPRWDYGTLFLLGTFLGAGFSALTSQSFRWSFTPSVWSENFGPGKIKRLLACFFGGALLLYGARLADGCTSGHGISGTLQLAVSGWVFFAVMFTVGSFTAHRLYPKR
jgi:hypothetical protein